MYHPEHVHIARVMSDRIASGEPAAGLVNVGNSCYINAFVQFIAHCEHIIKEFVPIQLADDSDEDDKSVENLQTLIKAMWFEVYASNRASSRRGVVVPNTFVRSLQLHQGDHGDSHEVMMYMLSRLGSALKRTERANPQKVRVDKNARRVPSRVTKTAWSALISEEGDTIAKLLYGQYSCATTCRTCGHSIATSEVFNHMFVSIPSGVDHNFPTVQSCLDAHFQPTKVSSWKCPACKDSVEPATHRSTIWRLPNILIVCLKRFHANGSGVVRQRVGCSHTLDLSRMISPGSVAVRQPTRYKLASIICHSGSQTSGHCWAFGRVAGAWYEYNDDRARPCETPIESSEAYMFAYECAP